MRLLDAREVSGRRAVRRLPRRDRRARPRAARLPDRVRRPGRRRRADRAQGRDRDEGRHDDGRLEDPRELRPGLRRDGRRALQGARTARCSARRTPTSSRWARRPRTRPSGRRATRGTRRACRAARAAAPPPRSRPGSRRGRSAPTRAARSSSRRRSAATSGCARRTAPSRATASSPSRRRSTRSARSRRTCATARSSTRSSPAATRTTRRRSTFRAVELPTADDLKGLRIGVPKELNEAEGIEPGVRDARREALERRGVARRRGRGVLAAALGRLRPRLLLPDRAGRGVVEPRALRRRALRAARRTATTSARW